MALSVRARSPLEGVPEEEQVYCLAAWLAGGGQSPKGAPENVFDVYWRPYENGFDTMLG